jgi:predicted Zn-dependent peptidase
MAVTREHFGAALDVLAAVVTKPRLDRGEFTKLKSRERDRVASLARTSAAWSASMVLYRELFELPTGVHPYSRYDATPKDVDAIGLEDCRRWHAREATPGNSVLVIAGDVDAEAGAAEVKRAFGAFSGKKPEAPTFAPPLGPKALSVYLVDRPGSPQAEVLVGALGPERKSPAWPALRATNQILGGGVAGRLFLDVREKRSLAYRTRSSLESLAVGPVPIVLTAGTQTAKAGLAVEALLQHFEQIGRAAPTAEETEIATRYLSDVFLVGVETVASVAGMTADLAVLGLPDDYYDGYRTEVRAVTPQQAFTVAKPLFVRERAVVVVAGDAERLGKPLSRFAPVDVVDPENGFVTKRTLPHDPTAQLELERIQGT